MHYLLQSGVEMVVAKKAEETKNTQINTCKRHWQVFTQLVIYEYVSICM